MLDQLEYPIPPDFLSWTDDQREDWAFDPDPLMHEQRWRKRVVMEYNASHAPVAVAEPEAPRDRYSQGGDALRHQIEQEKERLRVRDIATLEYAEEKAAQFASEWFGVT